MLRHWSQFVPNMSADIRGHEALHPLPPHHLISHGIDKMVSCAVMDSLSGSEDKLFLGTADVAVSLEFT